MIFHASKGEQKAKLHLFIHKEKVSEAAVQAHISENGIEVSDYSEIENELKKLAESKLKIGYDENSCNRKLFEAFESGAHENTGNIVEAVKAVKNTTEMEGMRKANIKNCVALIRYFAWVEEHLKTHPDTDLTEFSAAEKLEEFRKLGDLYVGPSFESISSIGPNGAVIHYKPEKDTALKMNNKEIYLLDSGV